MGKTNSDFLALGKCKRLIEKKLAWGPSHEWGTKDFSELSDLIYQKTKVRLSETTLKRIWGRVKYGNSPSGSTLEVLANFIGSKSWREFKLKENITSSQSVFEENRTSFLERKKVGIVAMVLIASLSYVLFSGSSDNSSEHIRFSSEVLAGKFPQAVKFQIDSLRKKRDDSTIRLYGDDNRIDVKIEADESSTIGMYYYPGVYKAELIRKGKTIKEKDVVLKSGNWLTTLTKGFSVDYFHKATDANFKGLRLSPFFVDSIGSYIEDKELIYHLTPPFINFVGDNFSVETTIGYDAPEGFLEDCQWGRIVLLGNKNRLTIPFVGRQCANTYQIQFGDKEIFTSKDYDLSLLQFDFGTKQDLNLTISNNKLLINTAHKENLVLPFSSDLGSIMGLRIAFENNPYGLVSRLNIVDNNNTEQVYSF